MDLSEKQKAGEMFHENRTTANDEVDHMIEWLRGNHVFRFPVYLDWSSLYNYEEWCTKQLRSILQCDAFFVMYLFLQGNYLAFEISQAIIYGAANVSALMKSSATDILTLLWSIFLSDTGKLLTLNSAEVPVPVVTNASTSPASSKPIIAGNLGALSNTPCRAIKSKKLTPL